VRGDNAAELVVKETTLPVFSTVVYSAKGDGLPRIHQEEQAMQNRFAEVCLSLIVLLLLAIACQPILQPQAVKAADPVQYMITPIPAVCGSGQAWNMRACQQWYNSQGMSGWHYVLSWTTLDFRGQPTGAVILFTK
jgi:hypothetical protein